MTRKPYESYLEDIAQLITIRDEDRPIYTKDFDIIRDHVLNGMKNVDGVFKKMYQGTSLFGSYANNVRIKYPNEFDVIFILGIPHSSNIVVNRDAYSPGYVNLDLEEVMEHLQDAKGYAEVYDCFNELIDEDDCLLRKSFQIWLKKVVLSCLKTYGNEIRGHQGDLYTLMYSKRGLAHTIYAKCTARSISIDLIPGISFGKAEWMKVSKRHRKMFGDTKWYAVPKPPVRLFHTKCAFMICNPKVERKLLLGRQNLKVVFRLLKSLRDKYGMKRLKSYFITTAFLWEVEKQKKSFWNNPLHILLEHMLESLADSFAEGCLPFYWDRKNNLLNNLDDEEIDDYAEKLKRAYETLRQYKFEPNLTYKRCRTHFELP
ncbi:cyclic GMP-AMP synthase-like receptor 1 isoform X1 [Anastrepha ludens]|uniref:cyclic GMP-AMP synthase-like receptor 1 isoform X1 n=1 Tax=Anastrepha ludens TaxID=28586 RepID=UPI0023AFB880|nr:cyclic GMP-AMP synthase-like receptor 1 isoform X1 [Anastrepha ludens]XP_053967277.1 cyclic GMP-AMP synthase-like receptor 1 isoform X1 [Anastrepha ludens]XP_053967278.1 cyclic GMP-AMP synthase-like receptor 1 isoform X1 [Anastrepha ludens]XP_053967279.1 cyclic GMP-AMP synthase-like receptor 1 isoform X1 [Anastrepha ludens]XP_053967280.1 cyclic GMP-AMP synthase-like receptor 1 isoform X1 [Anastrepha ludens]XP_053967281.1 cyclic GMP-AMP synthase-like receptor 1 isoform X1 [Anastrepha ludens]